MSQGSADDDLLFGTLGLQLGFLSPAALEQGIETWALNKSISLGDLLVDRGALKQQQRELLDALVGELTVTKVGFNLGAAAPLLSAAGSRALTPFGAAVQATLDRLSAIAERAPPAPKPVDAAAETVAPAPSAAADLAAASGPFDAAGLAGASGSAPRRFGDYELHEPLGRGGMGIVFRATQLRLKRTVALKMILAGQLSSTPEVERFKREAESAARLSHPAIVPIYEIGEHKGQHYFSMGYVEGGNLAERLRAGPLPPAEAARLVRQVAEAIQHAHDRGVVHRDLKPHNILLAGTDDSGAPSDREAASEARKPRSASTVPTAGRLASSSSATVLRSSLEPKVTDFGLARQLDSDSAMTRTGDVMGTPSYMAPEQAAGKRDIGPLADVYSLGAVLYHALTGRPPFLAATAMETVRQVLEKDPVSLRHLNTAVPRDLDTICRKCLRKDPARRYPSAQSLADDLGRYLAGEPIVARPVSRPERALLWARRHPALAGLWFVVVVFGLAMTWQWYETDQARRLAIHATGDALAARDAERQQRDRADTLFHSAQRQWYASSIGLAQRLMQSSQAKQAERLLGDCPPELRGPEWRYLERLLHPERRAYRLPAAVHALALSRDGRLLFAAGADGPIRLCNAESLEPVADLIGHTGAVACLAIAPDGERLASAGADKTIRLWDVATRTARSVWPTTQPAAALTFSSDGATLFASTDATITAYAVADGKARRSWQAHTQPISALLALPGAQRLVSASHDQLAKLWDVAAAPKLLATMPHQFPVNALAWDRQGSQLITAAGAMSVEGELRRWSSTGAPLATLPQTTYGIRYADVCADGTQIATADWDRRLCLWDVRMAKRTASLFLGEGNAAGIAFLPDGHRIVSANDDGMLRLWDVDQPVDFVPIPGHAGRIDWLTFGPGGRQLASAGADRCVRITDAASGQLERLLICPAETFAAEFSPDGHTMATASGDGVRLWDAQTGVLRRLLRGHTQDVLSVAFRPDGKLLASADGVWDELGTSPPGLIKLWDPADGRELATLRGHRERVLRVAFSPDGALLASASWDHTAKLWNPVTGQEVRTLVGHEGAVQRLAFSPDGKHLATASGDKTIRIWDVATGQSLFALHGHNDWVCDVVYSPDGKRLFSGSCDGTVRIWDAADGRELLVLTGHRQYVIAVAISPDGARLASAGDDQIIHLWEFSPPDDRTIERRSDTALVRALFDRGLSASEARAELERRTDLSAARRTALRQIIDSWAPDYGPSNAAAWRLVAAADHSAAEYAQGLRLAQRAHALAPTVGLVCNTLGVAQYRTGRFADALKTLQEAESLNRNVHTGEPDPLDLVFLGMTHLRLGQAAPAKARLEQARQLLKKVPWTTNSERQHFLQEAESIEKSR